MRFSLSSTTFLIVTLIVVDLASAANGTDANNSENTPGASSLSELKPNYLHNETEKGLQEMALAAPLTSMNLHQEMHLSDINGSAAVSSHYVGSEVTTTEPLRTEVSNITALDNFKGTISESFRSKINPHWLRSSPQSPATHYVFAVIFFFMAVFGLTGNALVIYIFMRCSSVRTPANNLILNLAVADFIIMLEAPLFIYNALNFGPATGEFGCKLYGLLGAAGGSVAIMTLCAISVDRYNVIVYPLNPSRSTTNNRSRLMILFVWVYSLPFFLIPCLEIDGIGSYTPEGLLTTCSFDYLDTSSSNYWFIMIYAIASYFLPLIIIAYCYFHILHVVLSAQKIQSSKEKNKQEVKLAGIVMGIIGLWAFAWTPYCIVALLGISGYGTSISPFASMLPSLFAKIACCIDPYLYAVTHPRFRTELEKIFCSGRRESSNFQTSYSRRQNDRNESECETINLGPESNQKPKPKLQRAESSFCEESTVSQ